MRKQEKRFLSVLLTAAMIFGMLPATVLPADAALTAEKPDVDVSDTGSYADAALGQGASMAYFVNGAFGGGDITVGQPGGKISGGGLEKNVDEYNMMNCFGIYRNGSTVSEQAAGFSHSNGQGINWGSGQYCNTLNMSTYNNNGGSEGSMTISIANNPTLKELAASGKLQMYFRGYACAGKEARKAWPDDHTYVWGWLKIDGSEKSATGKTQDTKKEFGSNGWVTLGENSIVTIEWKVGKSAGKFSNGWADKDVGLGDCVLLFRVKDEPDLPSYALTSNGNLSYSAGGTPEVLLGNDGHIGMDFTFSGTVASSLMGKNVRNSDDYNLLLQLGKRVLFYNTEGTGYDRQGEPVYMKLTKYRASPNGEWTDIADSDEARVSVLQGSFAGLHYDWYASYGDYYGNNPIPNEGDWAGLVSGSNSFNLIDSLVLASLHDLAGNPMTFAGRRVTYQKSGTTYTTNLQYQPAAGFESGNTYYYNTETQYYTLVNEEPANWDSMDKTGYFVKKNVLTGTVKLNNQTKSDIGNPFAVNTTEASGFNFIIDAVSPTYSKTSNAVQPDVLTDLVLNKGDSFDIALNFSEIVRLRQFNGGIATEFSANNLWLELNNGLRAKYVSGIGTKQLIFTVNVPDMYTLTVVQPDTWYSTYSNYYTKNGSVYTRVSATSAPTWEANKYYSYVADVTGAGQYLEINRMYVENLKGDAAAHHDETLSSIGSASYKNYKGDNSAASYPTAASYVLTDYVGNPLCELIGRNESTYDTRMAWAHLQIDNTDPEIVLTKQGDGSYTVSVTEAGSGVFHISNTTSGSGSNAGLVYYVWVNGKDNATAVKDAFIANNYEKVKRYSLAPGNDDKVTVSGTTYQLKSISADGNIRAATGQGDWYLLVFTADMTWDSARQLIQYGSASYKTDPDAYFTLLAGQLGISAGDMFEQVTPGPGDWATTYMNYYYKNGAAYSRIPQGARFPQWESGKYYAKGYTILAAEPAGWNPYQAANDGTYKKLADGTYVPIGANETYSGTKYKFDASNDYTRYYTQNSSGTFTPVKPVNGIPAFESGKYYAKYTPFTETVTADNAATVYVRDSDSDGAPIYVSAQVKFAPSFTAPVYDSTKQEVTIEPANWSTTYTSYYNCGSAQFNAYNAWKADAAPTWQASTYYSKSNNDYTLTTAAPDDWTGSYTSYFTGTFTQVSDTSVPTWAANTYYSKSDNTYVVTVSEPDNWETAYTTYYTASGNAAVTPQFTADQYYLPTYTAIETKTEDGTLMVLDYDEFGSKGGEDVYLPWADVCGDYYTESSGVYTKNAADTTYSAGTTYYRLSYVKQTTQPADWNSNYASYVTFKDYSYVQITADFPTERTTYYTRADNPSVLTEKPADWDSSFSYYSTSSSDFTPVQRLSCPAFAENTYYAFGFTEQTSEPANWSENYNKFYYKVGTDYVKADLDSAKMTNADITIVSDVPNFVGYSTGVFRPKAGKGTISQIAETITDATRKAAFLNDILTASTTAQKITVIRRYSEFAEKVHAADVAMLSNAASYAQWPSNNFAKDDSNWTWKISDYVDLSAPAVSFTLQDGTDATEDVKVSVTVTDTSDLSEVKYQFTAAGTVLTTATVDGWTSVSEVSGKEKLFTASTADCSIASGSYDLWVYAKDAAGNEGVTRMASSVTVNSDVAIQYSLSDPTGSAPYTALAGVTASFYGTVYGSDIFTRSFTVYAAIDDNATKAADAADWGSAITSADAAATQGMTTKTYAMPEKSGVTGYYYLHIKYTYEDSSNQLKTGLINKAYALNGAASTINFSQTGSDSEGITVEIAATGATSIQYAITQTSVTAQPTAWTDYSGALTLKTADYSGYDGVVRVWAKAGELVRSQDFNLNGSSAASGPVAKPKLTLVDVIQENSGYYAIVRFDDLGTALCVGAEYSVAVAPVGTTSNLTWQRWMPLDSFVKVKLGASRSNVDLRFKFRNGSNVSAESDYGILTVSASANGNGENWTIAERSTLREVGSTPGVTLNFTSKGGAAANQTVSANGVYEQSSGDFVVSNINNNPPSYQLTWSDSGYHFAATSVAATVTSEENITVTAVKFTPDGGSETTVSPAKTYLFKQNGTAVFTIQNEAGNTADVTAKVTWLSTPPTIAVARDYSAYRTHGSGDDLIANGVTLRLTSDKLLYHVDISGHDVAGTLSLDVNKNGVYQLMATDIYGNIVSQKIVVNNLVTSLDAPEQTGSNLSSDGKSVTVTFKGTASAKHPVYDGKKIGGAPMTDTYTVTKTYTRNGTYTNFLTDSLGNTVSYTATVSELDDTAPVITLPAGVISMNKTTDNVSDFMAWLLGTGEGKGNVTITDNKSDAANITVTLSGSTVDTTKIGAYTVIITATDKVGNSSSVRTTVYILPTSGMLVTDEHGVLFSSSSKDAAIVDRNGEKQVVLTIGRYDLMELTGASGVYNKSATITVTVKQGAYREGQMKYFSQVSKDQIVYSNRNATVTLNVSDLPGTGWYTVIVRNAEREREFTTFFINADN